MTRSSYPKDQVEPDTAAPFLCMRLMCSQNQAEVEAVRDELSRAGIVTETRSNPVADALGVSGVELWVQDERDFFDASRLYAQIQGGASGRSGQLAADPQGEAAEPYLGASALDAGNDEPALQDVNSAAPGEDNEPRHKELKQASSLLEKGIEEMFQRESELTEECLSLRGQVEELRQALAREHAARAREAASRASTERKQ